MQENAVSFIKVLKYLPNLGVVSTPLTDPIRQPLSVTGPPPTLRALTINYPRKGSVITGESMIRRAEE